MSPPTPFPFARKEDELGAIERKLLIRGRCTIRHLVVRTRNREQAEDGIAGLDVLTVYQLPIAGTPKTLANSFISGTVETIWPVGWST